MFRNVRDDVMEATRNEQQALHLWLALAQGILSPRPDGTYKFYTKGLRAAPAHEATITAMNVDWSIQAIKGLAGYSDGGSYEVRPRRLGGDYREARHRQR